MLKWKLLCCCFDEKCVMLKRCYVLFLKLSIGTSAANTLHVLCMCFASISHLYFECIVACILGSIVHFQEMFDLRIIQYIIEGGLITVRSFCQV